MPYDVASHLQNWDIAQNFLAGRQQAQQNALMQRQDDRAQQTSDLQRQAFDLQQKQMAQAGDKEFFVSALSNLTAAESNPAQFSRVADIVAANPVSQRHGITRDQITPENVAALRAQVGMAAPEPKYMAAGEHGVLAIQPGGQAAMVPGSAQPKEETFGAPIDAMYQGKPAKIQVGSNGTIRPVGGASPYNKPSEGASSGFDDPKVQDLQAAIGSVGYALPAGLRSKEQQLSLFRGLLRKYDGLQPDDIAHLLASNAVDFKAIGKATQAAATIGGRVEVANKELQAFVPIALDASAAVNRGSFVPFNRLKQAGQAAISDPDLKRLYVATQTILNTYDLLASRGGTDQGKRAENRRMLENADSPETYKAALEMIVKEGGAAGGAATAAMKASAFGFGNGGQPTGATTTPPLTNAQGWQLHQDANGNKAYVSPDGKQFQQVQ